MYVVVQLQRTVSFTKIKRLSILRVGLVVLYSTEVLSYYRTKVLSQVQYLASYHKYLRRYCITTVHVLHVKYIQFVNIQYNITLLPGTNASILRKSWISCRAARESTANGFFFHECMSLHPFLLDHLDRSFGEMCECPGHGGTLLSRITTV